MASLIRTLAPTALPIDIDEVKAGLRIDGEDEDDFLESAIAAAVDLAESRMHRAILPQTWRMTLDAFPREILLPWPIARTAAVAYRAAAGSTWIDLDADAISLSPGVPSIVRPAYGKVWPIPLRDPDSVRVTFETASWPTAAAVPPGIKHWLITKVGELFEQREASGPIEMRPYRFVDNLIATYQVSDYAWRSGVNG
jgi:uncharacterized phiE125 gp8 family phage protein